jgi:pimeloyl-ACP methyl ester carboxylesterase
MEVNMPIANLKSGESSVDIAYLDEGEGTPVMLIHGFASTRKVNWLNTGWVRKLADAGFRVVAFDNRGHGESGKFYSRSDYSLDVMAGDTIALMDFLSITSAHVVGYSMGARIAAMLAIHHADRVNRLVLSGNGWSMIEGSGDWQPIENALLAPDLNNVTDPRGRAFREFADQTGSDRKALAACVASMRELLPKADMRSINNETLIAIGSKDDVAGSGERLAAIMPNARYLEIPGRDHMRAVGDRVHMEGVLEFLTGE